MPSNDKGGRRAPSNSSARSFGAPKRAGKGGPSPKHRGYRPDAESGDAGRKSRWSAEERSARGHSAERPRGERSRDERGGRDDRGSGGFRGGERTQRPARGERPNWEPRGKDARGFGEDRGGRDDRAPRRFDRDDRAPRRFEREDRAPRRFEREERPARRDDRDDRGPRRFDRDERPVRRDDRDDRAPRRFDRDDRAPRRFDRDDRAPRRFDRDDRDDRAPRRFDREERPARRFEDDRPRRFDRDDRAPRRFDRDRRDERPVRRDDSSFYPSAEAKAKEAQRDDVVLERLEAEAIQAQDVEGMTFADLGLGGNITRAVAELGAVSPFAIQAATIPDVLAARDVLGRGRTGSGKTIAFGAPLVERLMQMQADAAPGQRRRPGRAPRAIILAPTRELALQIDRTVQPIAQSVGLFTTQLYGGVPYPRQVGALQRGVDIVIGTPGRIEDLVEQGRLDLSQIAITVLDEADHMCDLGFLEPVQRLIRRTPEGSQKLLFSATLDSGVATLVDEFLSEPAVHEVANDGQDASTIEHRVFMLDQRDKQSVLAELVSGPGKKLVFARTRAFAEDLTDMLEDEGIRAVALHGDLNQSRRTRNLERLTSGRASVLVATDVAARGIHVDDIELVVQADAPDEYKTYLHRSGRTGRAGKDGVVVTLVPFNRRRRTQDLLKRAEIEAEWTEVRPGDALVAEVAGILAEASDDED
ncbi:DEAD/DEAH box helicase [Homoserinibacter sp. YIM 151385]|uniref:DEAD/DEAH box helicase n=1 Tax=Homoserinibacter sp. YIM 151385 TaxID=2985506 RepID=UPI0022F129C2|nr:DEAD/DEAH box helicase [Homoserinibacter sp. YIM 151385]WBU37420.1 DEAD/DEAH box helicase [Homoserinibacter sp. YIM 151385]